MKSRGMNYRVAIVGASTLLGKEVLAVLEERDFPIARLVRFEADLEEPDLPIVDLRDNVETSVADQDVAAADLDFAFLATQPRELPSFLRPAADSTGLRAAAPGEASGCVVIYVGEGPAEKSAEAAGAVLRIPFLERSAGGAEPSQASRHFVSAHPATIVISTLLLRLAARFPLKSAVAHVFFPASEMGPRAIEELQKQTVNLLSFQKIPRSVFGAQLAFNLLPRLGRTRTSALADLEGRVRSQLRQYLGNRVPLPAVRLFQVPVFYSLAFSLYVETAQVAAPEALAAALAGERISVHRLSEEAPSQVGAAGSSGILVDAISPDREHAAGVWIWAAVDNIRLAAENAVEIAESLCTRVGGENTKR